MARPIPSIVASFASSALSRLLAGLQFFDALLHPAALFRRAVNPLAFCLWTSLGSMETLLL